MPFLREAMSRAWPEWQADKVCKPAGTAVTVVSNN